MRLNLTLVVCILFARLAAAAPADALFRYATNAYYVGEYPQAAGAFAQAATLQPAGGTLQNLGNAEWQRGSPGTAILAWEQSCRDEKLPKAIRQIASRLNDPGAASIVASAQGAPGMAFRISRSASGLSKLGVPPPR